MIDYGSIYVIQGLIALISKALYLWFITTAVVLIIVIAMLFVRNYLRVLKGEYKYNSSIQKGCFFNSYIDGEYREHFSVYLKLSTLHNIYYAK